MSSTIRVLLVDDHTVVRRGLKALINLSDDVRVIAEAENGREAIELFRSERPDVVLIDLRMPVMTGVETIEAVRAEFPRARFLVLTTYDGEDDVYRALMAGAAGYLLKNASDEELMTAIRTVHAGARYVPNDIAQRGLARAPGAELTKREGEVLRLIVDGRANRDIASELGISESTVKLHVYNLFAKLGVSSRTQAALAAIERGIVRPR